MEREEVPVSRRHQEWMLREVLKQQCPSGEKRPSFTLDENKLNELNELLIRHGRIDKEISIDQIQGR